MTIERFPIAQGDQSPPATCSVLAIDPSSTCTGYAVLEAGYDPEDPRAILEAGLIRYAKPDYEAMTKAAGHQMPRRLRHLLLPYGRMWSTVLELERIASRISMVQLVIEVPSGRAGTGSRRGASSSLAIYGAAAGCVYGWALTRYPSMVYPVTERDWIRSRKSSRQQQVLSMLGRRYDLERDRGGDCADAVCLGLWFLHHVTESPGDVEDADDGSS